MDLGNFNIKDLGKNLNSNKSFSSLVNNFINELSNYLQNIKDKEQNNQSVDSVYKEMKEYYDEREKILNTTNLEEEKTYVVSGIRDNTIKVVDIENGNEIQVYVATDNEILKKLNDNGIYNRIYTMDKPKLLNLNLTDNIIMKDNKLYSNSEKIEIKNNLAWRLLSDLYMGERETEGQRYEVAEIKENKVYLTNADGSGGYFSIHKELYPDFEVGDIVQKNNKKYSKVE